MALWNEKEEDDDDIVEIEIWEDPRKRVNPVPVLPPIPERSPTPGPDRDELSQDFRYRLIVFSRKKI